MKMAWSSNSGICGTDRITCMALTKQLVYAPSEQALTEIKCEVDKSPFQTFKKRLGDYWQQRKEWAVCFRKNFPTQGNYTNLYSEASIRIRKDILFQRNKAWNVVQMFNLLTQTRELYYQRHLISVATNRLDHFASTRFTVTGVKAYTIPSDDIVASDDPDVYTVVSQSDKNTMW